MTLMMQSTYVPTIGLEIHVQLKTKTKLFSRSKNDPDELEPNVNVSPVDLAHPGTLPVLNKEAVKHVLKVGIALGGELPDFTEWDRKNYFYPDIPKGYQISQYKYPLVKGGELGGVTITRAHLEEDTGRSMHDKGEYSLVDFNRAGVPLMELVTEPVIHSSSDAANFARELQLLLRTLGVSDANLEKGEMRVEANISVSKTDELGTKVEVKNLNSFKAAERAIEFEIARHIGLLEKGEIITQETRGWDETKQITFSQRSKEDAHDYRYFPDPDIPKLYISEIPEFAIEELKKEIPELPNETRARYASSFGLKIDSIETLLSNESLRDLFEKSAGLLASHSSSYQILANYILSDVAGLQNTSFGEISNIAPHAISEVVMLLDEGLLSSRGAKDLIALLYQNGGDARTLAEQSRLIQESNKDALYALVRDVVSEHTAVADEVRRGKETALQFLVGQGMKKSKGSANPGLLRDIFVEVLKESN